MGILVAFIISLAIALVFSVNKKRGSFAPAFVFFLVIFLAGIAGQYWVVPFGPSIWGVSWVPVLFITLIAALLFSAPSPHGYTKGKSDQEKEDVPYLFATLSIFMWLLFCVLAIAIFTGYLKK
jgi:hypothetical protein